MCLKQNRLYSIKHLQTIGWMCRMCLKRGIALTMCSSVRWQVWFQNRRAKFRKQERLNQQKSGSGQSSNSSSSQNGNNGNNNSSNASNGSAGGNNQSSSNLENAGNAGAGAGTQQSSQKGDSSASAVVAPQQLHQQNTPSAKEIKTNPEKTMNGMIFKSLFSSIVFLFRTTKIWH